MISVIRDGNLDDLLLLPRNNFLGLPEIQSRDGV